MSVHTPPLKKIASSTLLFRGRTLTLGDGALHFRVQDGNGCRLLSVGASGKNFRLKLSDCEKTGFIA